jgi:hypothetical protein
MTGALPAKSPSPGAIDLHKILTDLAFTASISDRFILVLCHY